MDVNCGSGFDNLTNAIDRGLITAADIDVALSHAMNIQFKLGFYDPFGLSPYDAIDPSVIDSPAHQPGRPRHHPPVPRAAEERQPHSPAVPLR